MTHPMYRDEPRPLTEAEQVRWRQAIRGRLMVRGFHFIRPGGDTKVWHIVAERSATTQCGTSTVGMPFSQDGIPADATLCADCTHPIFQAIFDAPHEA